jgi:hypothetical protein
MKLKRETVLDELSGATPNGYISGVKAVCRKTFMLE